MGLGAAVAKVYQRWEGAEGLSSASCQWSFAITQKTFRNNLILPNVHICSNSSEGSEPNSATCNGITHLSWGFRRHWWNVSRWLISTGEQRGKVGSDVSKWARMCQKFKEGPKRTLGGAQGARLPSYLSGFFNDTLPVWSVWVSPLAALVFLFSCAHWSPKDFRVLEGRLQLQHNAFAHSLIHSHFHSCFHLFIFSCEKRRL